MSPVIASRLMAPRTIALAVAIGTAGPAAAQAPRFETMPVRYAAAQSANYGGGFFEFLASGGAMPSSRRTYAPMEPDADARRAAGDPRYQRQVVEYGGS